MSSLSNASHHHHRSTSGKVIKEGWIRKLGGNKQGGSGNWKRRYLIMTDDLYYYESEQVTLFLIPVERFRFHLHCLNTYPMLPNMIQGISRRKAPKRHREA